MNPCRRSLALLLLALVAVRAELPPQPQQEPPEGELIIAPFGLRWGLGVDDLILILQKFKFQIVSRDKDAVSERVTVRGIPQKNLLKTIFHFEDNMLWEVELQLGDKNWNASDFSRHFEQTKQILNHRYKNGIPVVLEKQSDNVIETVLGGYEWRQHGGNLRLYLFQARQNSQELHILSQHYRAP